MPEKHRKSFSVTSEKPQKKSPIALLNGRFLRIVPFLTLLLSLTYIAFQLFHYRLLLEKLARRTLFYATLPDAWNAVKAPHPGYFLDYLGKGLTTLGMHPLLFIAVFLLFSTGFFFLWRFTFRQTAWLQTLCLIPLLMFTCQLQHLGFSVYLFKQTGFLFVYLLAVISVLLLFLFWRTLSDRFGNAATLLVFPVAATYPLLGMPAAFACLLIGIHAICTRRFVCAATAFLLAVSTPALCAEYFFGAYSFVQAYSANTILIFEPETAIWNTLAVIAILPLPIAVVVTTLRRLPFFTKHPAFHLAAFLLPLAFFSRFLPFENEKVDDVFSILQAERCAAEGRWRDLLSIDTANPTPHRMLAAYRILAMFRTETLPELLFQYPFYTRHTTTTVDTMKIDGYRLLYHYGLIYTARKWCWESCEDLSFTPEALMFFGQAALISNELDAARDWFTLLSRCPFYGKEAAEGLRLALNPELPVEDEELISAADLFRRLAEDPANPVFENSRKLEEIIYNRYANMRKGSPRMVHLYLASSLLTGALDAILDNLESLAEFYPNAPLPRYYQEALLAALAKLPPEEQPPVPQHLISPEIYTRFLEFQKTARQYFGPGVPRPPEKMIDAFTRTYRDTYFFYEEFQP